MRSEILNTDVEKFSIVNSKKKSKYKNYSKINFCDYYYNIYVAYR